MAKRKSSKLLVVDASVARAAGKVSLHPSSTACRETLTAILRICHRMAMSELISREWDRHQSGFARTWRRSMMSRKKIEIIQIPTDTPLRRELKETVDNPREQAEIEKDRHLVETALLADGRIVSSDEIVREYLRKRSDMFADLASLIWANPIVPDESVVAWLEAGAPGEKSRQLGYKDIPGG